MKTTKELLALIEARRKELGLSQTDVGRRAFGKDDNSVISNMKRGSSPTFDRLNALCDALGLELHIGLPRPPLQGMAEPESDRITTEVQAARGGGYLPLPWLDAAPGKGSSPVAFLDNWASENGLILDNLAAITPSAVLLEGFEAKRTLAVIDKSTPRRGFGLWCLKETGGTTIARTLFDDDDLIIEHPDPFKPSRLVRRWRTSETRPAGLVVWLSMLPAR